MMKKLFAALVLFQWQVVSSAQQMPKRMIDRCAQDGLYFYAWNDNLAEPVEAGRDGVTVRIEHSDPKGNDAVVAFSREGHKIVQDRKNFDAAEGWVTVSHTGAFAATWNYSASASDAQLFRISSSGDIVEDLEMIPGAERQFLTDAKRYCRNPGLNTEAIKWIDDTHLLISINAWLSGFCYSNFTEGFVLDISSRKIQRKLTERQLINLPAVCTWNIVPLSGH